ncbi:hypothetical protein [Haladaptatus halobius]|uniref:hypothetical protein n=1 Tax=Haladaptatus halobius TaxID=2884875 RepID=UPI001D09C2EB|nr:hypothetical protein [Haladaptatus halobius]
MGSSTGLDLPRIVLIVLLLLATPVIAFFLIAGAATADTGFVEWFCIAVVPLALLGTGLYLLTGDEPSWWRSVENRA